MENIIALTFVFFYRFCSKYFSLSKIFSELVQDERRNELKS
jgi:hypothetical protein